MAEPRNKEEFRQYIFRRMGYPIQPIPVDTDQAYDRIDDALAMFREYHYNATERLIYTHELTSQDISNRYITIPEHIIGISQILDRAIGGSFSSILMNNSWYIAANALNDANSSQSLVPYYLAMTNLSNINFFFGSKPTVRYNRHNNKLTIQWDWSLMSPGEFVVVDTIAYVNADDYADVWSDRWLKEYAFNLMKRQMGENLKLTGNIQLLGGITLNGDQIWVEANEKIRELEEQLIKSLAMPPMDFIA